MRLGMPCIQNELLYTVSIIKGKRFRPDSLSISNAGDLVLNLMIATWAIHFKDKRGVSVYLHSIGNVGHA